MMCLPGADVRAVAAVALAMAAVPAAAQSVPEAWYGSARSGFTITDQNFRNDGRHDALTIGRAFARDYALELELTRERRDFGSDAGRVNESVALHFVTVNREPLWDPYFLAGIGRQRLESAEGPRRRPGSDWLLNVGIGGQWELIAPERVFLRADLRLRYVLDSDTRPNQAGTGDGVFTIGLSVPFGR